MPEGNERKSWTSGAVLMALAAFAAARGIPSLMLALVVLPVVSAVLAATGGWMITAGVCAVCAIGCVVRMPGLFCLGGVLWCAACGAVATVPMKRRMMRPLLWTVLSLAAWCAMLGTISMEYSDTPARAMAQALCDMVNESSQRNAVLINAYSMGLARLDDNMSLSSLNYILMPEEIRLQLLYSMRVSLELALPQAICDSMVVYSALTALLCTALPDWRRRHRGEKGVFPPMEEWYIPRGLGLAILALGLGWLIATLSDGGADGYFGLLCLSVFRVAYTLQGICLMLWLAKRMGIRGIMRNIGALILSLIAPIIPMIMGLIDQRRDARHLRPEEVEEL